MECHLASEYTMTAVFILATDYPWRRDIPLQQATPLQRTMPLRRNIPLRFPLRQATPLQRTMPLRRNIPLIATCLCAPAHVLERVPVVRAEPL
eukprot:344698-Chlamydomonas_euryale.AAC.5